MTRVDMHLWIDPTFGASGDMLLGSLAAIHGSIEPLGRLRHLGTGDSDPGSFDPSSFDPSSFEITEETVIRASLSCNRVQVMAESTTTHRKWSDIDALIAGSDLPEAVKQGARRTFRLLGEVEAAQHGVSLDDVHFHEVGAVDAIVDIVGAWLLVDAISPSSITVGPVGLGRGQVQAAHGILPLPAPATVRILEGCPVVGLDTEGETCTPTGAALLVTLADRWGPLPSGTLAASARGAGGRDPATHPNVVTIIAVDQVAEAPDLAIAAVLLEANIDDATPEVLAHTIERLLSCGADDAWIVPIVMKKGRPAHEVRILCAPHLADELRRLLMAETGSLGCRTMPVTKHPLARSFETIDIRGHAVRIKIGPHGAKPEYDDLASLAAATGVPLRRLAAEAIMAFEGARSPDQHDGP